MTWQREIGKILAPFFVLAAFIWAWVEFAQAIHKIQMIIEAITFISDTYHSVSSVYTNFTLWKNNATQLITQPVFSALPFLDVVPDFIWDFAKALVLFLIGLWILDQLLRS